MTNPRRTPVWGQYLNSLTGAIVDIISPAGALKVDSTWATQNLSAEVSADLDDVELIPAPGEGKRIVIKYGSIRTEGNSGYATFKGTYNEALHLMGMIYPSKFQSFAGFGVTVRLDENTNFYIKSTVGAVKLFYYVIYIIEDME